MVELFDLTAPQRIEKFRKWPKAAQYACIAVVGVAAWFALVWVLRGVVVPTAIVGVAAYFMLRRSTGLSQKEQVALAAVGCVAAFFLVGPWFVPVFRIAFLAALVVGFVMFKRRKK